MPKHQCQQRRTEQQRNSAEHQMLRRLCLIGAMLTMLAAPAEADWTVATFIGGAHTKTDRLILVLPGTRVVILEPVAFESRSFRPPLYYGARLAHFFGPGSFWGIEGEQIHLKIFARPPSETEPRIEFAMSHGLNLVLANLILRTPAAGNNGRVRRILLTARAGIGPTIPHVEANLFGQRQQGYQFGRLAMAAAGGVELQIAQHIGLLAEYKVTHTQQRVDVGDMNVRTRVLTHHGVVGLTWRL